MSSGLLKDVRLETLLAFFVTISMLGCYVLFPIWKVAGDLYIGALFALCAGVAIPILCKILIGTILDGHRYDIDLVSLLKRQRRGILYFVVTFSVYLLVLGPLIVAPLVPRGDESYHIYRLLTMTWLYTLGGRIPNLVVALGLLMGAAVLIVLVLLMSSKKGNTLLGARFMQMASSQAFKLFGWIVIAAGCVGLALIMGTWDISINSFVRFGPLQPILEFFPHLVLGYSDAMVMVTRTANLALMVLASAVIGKVTYTIMSMTSFALDLSDRTKYVISTAAGWVFLSFLPIVDFSTQVYLASGVALLFALNMYLLVRTLGAKDQRTQSVFLVLLALAMGFGSLWKRVILVQSGTIFLILLIAFVLQSNSEKKEQLILWLKSALIYALIFGPWLIIIQFRGLVGRAYILEPAYLFPPHIFDYILRLDNQMGLLIGLLCYGSLFVTILLALLRRSTLLFSLPAQYLVWYVFFTLDDGWAHDVDRFFVPALSIMAVTLAIVIAGLLALSMPVFRKVMQRSAEPSGSQPKQDRLSRQTYIAAVLLVVVVIPASVGFGQNCLQIADKIGTSLDKDYVPYDEAAVYIHSLIQGNGSQLWSRAGPSSLSFYMNKYGDYPITPSGFGIEWQPDPGNVTPEAFVDFLVESDYTVLALPSPEIAEWELLSAQIVEQLVLRHSELGFTDMVTFTFGSNDFYVWTL